MDNKEFKKIYDEFWPMVYRVAMKTVNDQGIAMDITHDIFFAILQKKDVEVIQSMKAYLYIVTKNMAVHQAIKIKRRKEVDKVFASRYTKWAQPDDVISNKEIMEAIRCLHPQQRRVFYLSRFMGLSLQQIADKMNLKYYTVKNHVCAATIRLETILKKLDSCRGASVS